MAGGKNTIPALEKSLELMELLASVKGGMTQTEARRRLGLSISTVYRIFNTLLARNWVRRRSNGKYVPGNGMMPLLDCFRGQELLLNVAKAAVHRLSDSLDMACKLSVRRGSEQVTLERAEPAGPYSLVGTVNSSFPVIEGSVGAALLADESGDAVRRLAEVCIMDLPEKREPALVLEAMEAVRRDGYVLNARPNRWNVAAMSAPLRDMDGAVAGAVTIVGTISDFSGGHRHVIAKALLEAVAAMSAEVSAGEK